MDFCSWQACWFWIFAQTIFRENWITWKWMNSRKILVFEYIYRRYTILPFSLSGRLCFCARRVFGIGFVVLSASGSAR